MLELLINQENEVKTIMLVENGILVEKHEEHKDKKRLEGNIYIGKVNKVLPGMQTAFVDIGIERNSLIKLKDVVPKVDESKEKYQETVKIQDIIKENNRIIVQINKDGTEKKGAKVSTHLKLPGRFTVLMPECDIVTISQKIEDKAEKQRLIRIARENLPKKTGIIMRTSSNGISEENIKKDIENLLLKWKEIKEKSISSKQDRALIYDNKTFIRKTLIDILDSGLKRIIVNEEKTYKAVKDILEEMNHQDDITIEIKKGEDLFNMYTLNKQIDEAEKRKIWLKCGGFITIDKTEALTAIDVNSGKYTGNKDLEKTIYKVNQEATIEIAKQLRLRDIGGIIIIDYIDMHTDENKKNIEKLLQECLKKDRSKCQLGGFTKMNLYEMTRKHLCSQCED